MLSFILNFHIPFHISQSEQDYFPQNERRCFSWENATPQLLINLGLLPVVLHILIRSQSETVWYFSLCQINMLHLNIHLNMFYNSNSAENKRVCIIHLSILQHTLRGGGKKPHYANKCTYGRITAGSLSSLILHILPVCFWRNWKWSRVRYLFSFSSSTFVFHLQKCAGLVKRHSAIVTSPAAIYRAQCDTVLLYSRHNFNPVQPWELK